ncbi:MAG: class I SAM-dependent methyltransferase [Butyrivibrio sp.]|nr:class I SAM-dependent methyltransferase [Butyrivibrio sp.]
MGIQVEIKTWQKDVCVETMRQIGFQTGGRVVDFGCGIGNYTLPLSMAVQESGEVYAVDIDRHALGEIRKKAEESGIHNIRTMCPEQEGRLAIPDSSVDGFLIYDLIHSLGRQREQVLSESRRVLKNGAILSILPFHMAGSQVTGLVRAVETLGFELDGIQRNAGLHFEMHRYLNRKSEHLADYERGDIYNFRKTNG